MLCPNYATVKSMKIMRLKAVLEMTGLPRSTMYHFIKKSDFPKPIKLGLRSVGWLEEEILSWIRSRRRTLG